MTAQHRPVPEVPIYLTDDDIHWHDDEDPPPAPKIIDGVAITASFSPYAGRWVTFRGLVTKSQPLHIQCDDINEVIHLMLAAYKSLKER